MRSAWRSRPDTRSVLADETLLMNRLVRGRSGSARQVFVLEARVPILRLQGPSWGDLALPAGADRRAVETETAATPLEAAAGVSADDVNEIARIDQPAHPAQYRYRPALGETVD